MTRLEIIQRRDIYTFFPQFPEELEVYALHSNPIFAGILDHITPFCVVGVVPQHDSGTCALWGWNTPLVAKHPYIYARWSRRLITRVHTLYPRIVGECSHAKMSWLAFLGATFGPPTSDMIPFTIEAHND